MIVTFDLGNSDLSFAVFKGEELVASFRTSSDRQRSVDEYAKVIKELLFSKDIEIGEIKGSILSSVVPQLTRAVESAIKRVLGVKPVVLGPGMKTGLAIRADNPTEVGADLVAGCVGAIKKYNGSAYYWWLRSALVFNGRDFYYVADNGGWHYTNADSNYGISPAFRLG